MTKMLGLIAHEFRPLGLGAIRRGMKLIAIDAISGFARRRGLEEGLALAEERPAELRRSREARAYAPPFYRAAFWRCFSRKRGILSG